MEYLSSIIWKIDAKIPGKLTFGLSGQLAVLRIISILGFRASSRALPAEKVASQIHEFFHELIKIDFIEKCF